MSYFFANEKTVQPMPYGRGFHGGDGGSRTPVQLADATAFGLRLTLLAAVHFAEPSKLGAKRQAP